MSEEKIEAIILKQQDYRENDALLTVLSLQHGKIGFVCRGIRKMVSKNATSCMPFVRSEMMFDYKEGATLFSLKSAHVLQARRHVREDLERMSAAQLMSEVADRLLQQGEADLETAAEVYELLDECLDWLDQGEDLYLILCLYLAQVLKIEGLEPVVDECVLCSNTQIQTISIKEGGFLCPDCAAAVHEKARPVDVLRRFRLINRAEMEHKDILKKYGPWTKNDAGILVEFITIHTGIPLESWRFLERLCN